MAKNKKYEDSHFEEYLDTQTIVDIDIERGFYRLCHECNCKPCPS